MFLNILYHLFLIGAVFLMFAMAIAFIKDAFFR